MTTRPEAHPPPDRAGPESAAQGEAIVEELVERDEPPTEVVAFRHSGVKWNETETPRQLAMA